MVHASLIFGAAVQSRLSVLVMFVCFVRRRLFYISVSFVVEFDQGCLIHFIDPGTTTRCASHEYSSFRSSESEVGKLFRNKGALIS